MPDRAEQNAWVQRVLGVALTKDAAELGQADDGASELQERMNSVLADAAALVDEQATARIRDMAGSARVALVEGKAGAAHSLIDAMETALFEASRAARNAAAAAESGHKVAYAKLLLDWRRAQKETLDQIRQFVGMLLADKAVQADPRYEEVKEAADGLTELMPQFSSDLEDLLDDLEKADDPRERARMVTAARAEIAECQNQLDSADELMDLASFAAADFAVADMGASLRDTLHVLAVALSARQ